MTGPQCSNLVQMLSGGRMQRWGIMLGLYFVITTVMRSVSSSVALDRALTASILRFRSATIYSRFCGFINFVCLDVLTLTP